MSTQATQPTVTSSIVTRNLKDIDASTNNIYESVVIASKRANQLSMDLKEDLQQKLSEFSSTSDSIEEVFENREQIEVSKKYERMPKSTLIALDDFLNGKVYHKIPTKEA